MREKLELNDEQLQKVSGGTDPLLGEEAEQIDTTEVTTGFDFTNPLQPIATQRTIKDS